MEEGRYEFDAADVIPLVQEAMDAPERLLTEAQRYVAAGVDLSAAPAELPDEVGHPATGAEPGLWLMNDKGIYLRSNAKKGGERVAHARGYRAGVQVGDVTLCEYIDARPLQQLQPGDTLVVSVTQDKVRLALLRE